MANNSVGTTVPESPKSSKKNPNELFHAMNGGGKSRLQDIYKAAYAIQAAKKLLDRGRDGEEEFEQGSWVAGALADGIEVLSRVIQDDSEQLLYWIGATPWKDGEEGGTND
jgi:hypothetical protein